MSDKRKIIGVTVGTPISPKKIEDKINPVKTVNGKAPDENGNVEIEAGGNVQDGIYVGANLRGMTVCFEQIGYVSGSGYEVMFKAGGNFEIFAEDDYYQVTIEGVTEGHNTGGFNAFSYTFPDDRDYIISVYDEYVLKAMKFEDAKVSRAVGDEDGNSIRETYAKKKEIPSVPTKVSQLENDKKYLTSFTEGDPTIPDHVKGITEQDIAKWNGKSDFSGKYSDLSGKPTIPSQASDVGAVPTTRKVNGKALSADITLSASDVGARPSTWTPTAEQVGARPDTWTPTYSDVGADKSGAAASAVSGHNTSDAAHNDIRLLIAGLVSRLDAIANSDDTTLDQMAEVVKYIKDNRDLISQITTDKVNVSDIVNNLATNVSNRPLSAAQGVALKALIDAIDISGKLDASKLPEAINTALAQAKASGVFDGEDGEDGKTPVKGVDYFTEADKSEFSEYIASELAKRGQLKPEYANSIEECTDQTKLYVLPDGFIYAYMMTEVEVDSGTKPAFTNLKDQTIFRYKERYSLSGGAFKANNSGTAFVVPVPSGATSITLRLKGFTRASSYPSVYGGTSVDAFSVECGSLTTPDSEGITTFDFAKDSSITYITFNATGTTESDFADTIITINEPIEYTTGTETIVTEAFANTGRAFVPADYEDRMINLENQAKVIPENTRRIEALEKNGADVDENAVVHDAVGNTYPASQKPAEPTFEGYDIDIFNSWSYDILDYIDEAVSGKETVTKEILGKDASGQYDIARYTYAKREHIAWCRENYPKMYAWKNGTTIIYSVSVSPRKNDTMYSTPYIGTAHGTVTAVNATNRSRTVGGVEFVRHESGDIMPTVVYTDKDDERNGNASITHEGATYNRYPLGDLGANRKKLAPIFIYANEHGITSKEWVATNAHETKMCGLVAARIMRDFAAERQSNNPLYKYIRDNCMLIVIPVANPYGFNYNLSTDNNSLGGYYNANKVNINRNYDTSGWDYFKAENPTAATGAYAGSEIETQYVMNTMVESGAIVAMSLHGLSGTTSATRGQCKYQGQQPDGSGYNEEKLAKISSFLKASYGYQLYNYDSGVADNMPDVTAKSPSYITHCGAYGGIIEFSPADSNKSLEGFVCEMKSKVIENAYAQTINLTAMWLSDYLED